MSKAKAPKFPVVSSLDSANVSLVEGGKALIGQGTELETAWFKNSVVLLNDKKISVRGVQASMDEALKGFSEDVKFPSLTQTMCQYFVQAAVLMSKEGWVGSPVEAIRLVQSGKRSSAFKDSKEFDGALATATSAKAIVAKAKQPKRDGKVKAKVEAPVATTLEGAKVQTFSEAVSELLKVASTRTSHFLTEQGLKDARVIMALLNKQIKAQESKDAEQVAA
jgi:hypothetical protein